MLNVFIDEGIIELFSSTITYFLKQSSRKFHFKLLQQWQQDTFTFLQQCNSLSTIQKRILLNQLIKTATKLNQLTKSNDIYEIIRLWTSFCYHLLFSYYGLETIGNAFTRRHFKFEKNNISSNILVVCQNTYI